MNEKFEGITGYLFLPTDKKEFIDITESVERIEEILKVQDKIKEGPFWVRFFIQDKVGSHVSFPWYDSMEEMKQFISEIKKLREGEEFSDCEQSWEIIATRRGDAYEFSQLDDTGGSQVEKILVPAVKIDRTWENLKDKAKELIEAFRCQGKEIRWMISIKD